MRHALIVLILVSLVGLFLLTWKMASRFSRISPCEPPKHEVTIVTESGQRMTDCVQ